MRTPYPDRGAADRSSFGCSDDTDLTYFGEAFYRDALPKGCHLREAFETARAAIKQRELSRGTDSLEPTGALRRRARENSLRSKWSELARSPARAASRDRSGPFVGNGV